LDVEADYAFKALTRRARATVRECGRSALKCGPSTHGLPLSPAPGISLLAVQCSALLGEGRRAPHSAG
jgi:hypothetical protein